MVGVGVRDRVRVRVSDRVRVANLLIGARSARGVCDVDAARQRAARGGRGEHLVGARVRGGARARAGARVRVGVGLAGVASTVLPSYASWHASMSK